jgi:hypothetical protein
VPYPDVARLVSLYKQSVGKTAAASLRAVLLALQAGEDLKWDFIYLLNFSSN